MWKRKDSTNSQFAKSSFYSSGFYENENHDNGTFSTSMAGVLPPSERVQAVPRPNATPDVLKLVSAVHQSQEFDALRLSLKLEQWAVLGDHLQPFSVQPTQIVMAQGQSEMTVYLVESGTLGVHHEDSQGQIQLATVGGGSVVGEGAFFSRTPRNATVQAMSTGRLWALSPMRYAELAHKHPMIALALVTAFGSVVTRRMSNRPKRVAVT